MTGEERVQTAFNLEKPDRVPVVFLIGNEGVASLAGNTQAELAHDTQAGLKAHLKVFDEYGGWDCYYGGPFTGIITQVIAFYPMEVRVAGRELPDDYIHQTLEKEVMQIEDYEKICEMGFNKFYYEDYLWRVTSLDPKDLNKTQEEIVNLFGSLAQEMGKRNTTMLTLNLVMHPFFELSLMRSMVKFTEDLYYRPDIVEKTIKRMTDDWMETYLPAVKQTGIKRWTLVDERASAFYYPLSIPDRFWWPYTEKIVDAFWSEGIVTIFHLDTPWTKNISDFKKRLPKGSYVLSLDSTTDIFEAKEVVRGHGMIHGDVPAAMLTLSKPEVVENYVKKLIDEVGDDGGFILGVGCSMPPKTKPENLQVLLNTVKTYELSK